MRSQGIAVYADGGYAGGLFEMTITIYSDGLWCIGFCVLFICFAVVYIFEAMNK